MSSRFTKAILSVGTYHSPDGAIEVTPERLRHWSSEVKRVQSAGYQIPMHWDHAPITNIESLSPVRMSNGTRSAANSVGKLHDFKLSKDGKSAEITVETLTESAREKVASNAVFVSPVILKSWKDSNRRTYTDVIGSVDLVDYPVDNSQGPFVPAPAQAMSCCLRMSLSPSNIYRLSETAPVDDEKKDDATEAEDTKPEVAETEEETTTSPTLTSVLEGLAKMKIVLPEDTTVVNLLDRLNTALMTAAAQSDLDDAGPAEDPGSTVVTDPAIATMSLRLNQMENRLLSGEKAKLVTRLESLLKSGRCTPAEHDAKSKSLAVTRMSLAKDDTVDSGDFGKWVADRETLPEGACWDPSEKLKRMSLQESKAPEKWNSDEPDIEAMKQQKAQMLRR